MMIDLKKGLRLAFTPNRLFQLWVLVGRDPIVLIPALIITMNEFEEREKGKLVLDH